MIAVILIDRFLTTGSVVAGFRLQNAVLSLLIPLLHVLTILRIDGKRNPAVLFSLLLAFLAVYAVSLWESGSMPAVLLVYAVTLGVHVVKPAVMFVIIGMWVLGVASLAAYPTPWDEPPLSPPGQDARSLLYLAAVGSYFCHSRLGLNRSLESRRREIRALRGSVEELATANMSYNTFVQMAESQAARHERSRITRDIHDGVGYALTNLIMLAESTQDLLGDDPRLVRKRLATIRNQAKLALNDTRRALRDLRTAERGLMYGREALMHMMDVFRQATGVETRGEFLVPPGVLEAERTFPVVYRFVQEALTNSFRHGSASCIEVRLFFAERDLIVSVSDNGNAPELIHEGIGLQGMRERLGEIGGSLSYHTLQGFTIIARLPVGHA